jgi:hypothetical protein
MGEYNGGGAGNSEWTVDGNGNLVPKDGEPVSIDEISTGAVEYDYRTNYPQWPRQPERSGPLEVGPHPYADNPVISLSDISDRSNVNLIGDPFIVYDTNSNVWRMFFEVRHDDDGDGTNTEEIAHATSPDGLTWTYDQVVLGDGNHLAFPQVMKEDGAWYMVPEQGPDEDIIIYEADTFPTSWSAVETIITGKKIDPALFKWEGRWYLFAYDNSVDPDELELWYSDSSTLTGGDWSEHPNSPIRTGVDNPSRPAGRPIVYEDYIDAFFMVSPSGDFGDRVEYYRVTELTTSSYNDTKLPNSPIIHGEDNGGWNADGMHHIDRAIPELGGKPVISVDGASDGTFDGVGIYTDVDTQSTLGKLTLSSDATLSQDSSWVTIPLDAKSHDVGRITDPPSSVITIPRAGYYEMKAGWFSSTNWSTDFVISTRIYDETNSAELGKENTFVGGGSAGQGNTSVTHSQERHFDGGEKIRIDIFNRNTTDITIDAGEHQTFLSVKRVR